MLSSNNIKNQLKLEINKTIKKNKISNKLLKHIQKYDNNIIKSIKVIKNLKLYNEKIIKKESEIPRICNTCLNCIKSINFCIIYEKNNLKLHINNNKCIFKIKI